MGRHPPPTPCRPAHLLAILALLLAGPPCRAIVLPVSDLDRPAGAGGRRGLKLTGGTDEVIARYPYYTQVRFLDPASPDALGRLFSQWPVAVSQRDMPHKCNGVLVRAPAGVPNPQYNFVLTAASCVEEYGNPAVIIGSGRRDLYNGQVAQERGLCWPNIAGCPEGVSVYPTMRTTYASYAHPLYNPAQPGGPFDLALIVLNAQAPPIPSGQPNAGQCGAQCLTVATGAPPAENSTTLFALGMGLTSLTGKGLPAPTLQELRTRIVSSTTCGQQRAAPTGIRGWRLFNRNPPLNGNATCTSTTSAVPAGLCDGDGGAPLVFKSTTGAALDQLYGVASSVVQSCNSASDPNVFTDLTRPLVANWLLDTMRRATPALNASGFAGPTTVATPNASPGVRVVYPYSVTIVFRYLNTATLPVCTQADRTTGLSIKWVAKELMTYWSAWILKKGFFDARTKTPFKTAGPREQSNYFAVDLIRCRNNEIRLDWSSSKGYDATKIEFDQLLLPADSADFSSGARFWANQLRCEMNLPFVERANLVISFFNITQNVGGVRKTIGNYRVDWAAPPPDC